MWRFNSELYTALVFRCGSDPSLTTEVQRFRKALFIDVLGWELQSKGDLELDEFDTDRAIYSALLEGDRLVASFRAIRTDEDYLAAKVFPELATLHPYPRRHDVWEISRFGVLGSQHQALAAKLNYALMFQFAVERGARALLAVADPAYERYLARHGIRSRRYGPPQLIAGSARPLTLVAGEIPLEVPSSNGSDNFLKLAHMVKLYDQTLVVGRSSISA